MGFVYCDKMLSKREIEVLSYLAKNPDMRVPIYEIADGFDWSESYASRVISGLQERGFIRAERDDGKKFVSASNVRPIELLGDLVSEFDHVDFPELISGSALVILYYLDSPRTATELAELSRISRNTVYRKLDSLQRVGIVGKDYSRYQLTEPFSSLSALARSVAHHDHRQEARSLTEGVSIIWERHDEYLFRCDAEFAADGFHLTGPSVFEEFGIPLFTRERLHYLRSEQLSRVTAADLVCHTLLIDDSTRYRTYCLLLIEGQDIDPYTLKERAEYYDSEARIDLVALTEVLLSYLETDGNISNEVTPRWEDFKRTAADYNISV